MKTLKAVNTTHIKGEAGLDIAILLMEETLSDGSKVYDVVTKFYGNDLVKPHLELSDTSCTDYQEAYKTFNMFESALAVLKDSEIE